MEKNELSLFSEIEKSVFCSKEIESKEDKVKLYQALESCDVLLNDIVGTTLEIVDVYTEAREVPDEETGEMVKKYRTILFDVDGKTYATGSYGVYNSLKRIFKIFGLPNMWDEPLKVEVKKRTTSNNKKSLILNVLV